MNILLYINKDKDKNYSATKYIVSYLIKRNVQVFLTKEEFEDIGLDNVSLFSDKEKIDCMLILGGDGTFLKAAHEYYKYEIPFFGINLGRVGYLLNDEEKVENILDKIIKKEYTIVKKSLLEVDYKILEKKYKTVCFNEVVLHRGLSMNMIKLEVKINDDWKHSFYADGILVATSMGSSAYNLSSGGPLILPTAPCFVISGICAQSGVMPSIVTSDNDVISIRVSVKSASGFLITVDGRKQYQTTSEDVLIKRAKEYLNVINIKNIDEETNHIVKIFNGYIK